MNKVYLIIVMLALSLFCGGSGPLLNLEGDYAAVKEELARAVPPGTGIDRAEEIMRKNGFACARSYGREFAERFGEVKRDHPPLDYIYCDREEGVPVSRRWQVALVFREGSVTDILVSKGITGP